LIGKDGSFDLLGVRRKAAMSESSLFAEGAPVDYEMWRDLLHSEYGGELAVSEPNAFAGWWPMFGVCGFQARANRVQCGSDAGCNAYRTVRTQRHARLAGLDDYLAVFQWAGTIAVNQNDHAVEAPAGDIVLLDMSRPWTFSSSSRTQRLVLTLPRQSLISHLGFEPQGGFCARTGTLATRLLNQLVRGAIEQEALLAAPAQSYLQMAVYDLLGALIAPSDPFPRQNTDKLFARTCGIIKERFADPQFGPGEAAAEAGVSLRYLQKLFTFRGTTCVHYIQSLRLQHATRLLERRASLDLRQPLSEIAYACGFNDYPYFVRKFKQRFGYPPSAHAGPRRSA
jgi:AraC family transcriptional regulator, positive regulator of tynA and feaB